METEQDTCSMEEGDMKIDHLENTDSNQQENIDEILGYLYQEFVQCIL
jgi:hypothetical protein